MHTKYGAWARLLDLLTGGTTVRSCTEEFGPTIGAAYRVELGEFSDADLLRLRREEVLERCRKIRAERERRAQRLEAARYRAYREQRAAERAGRAA